MIWHPLSLSLLSLDFVSLYFLFWATLTSVRIVLHWSAGSSSPQQILLESAAETASIQGRIVIVLQIFSFVFLLWGVASVFPQLVPGAMCGTGVLQAAGETGERMLLLRISALIALFVWYQLDKSNRLLPEGMLSPAVAKAMLVAMPFILMGAALTVNMLYHLDVAQTVDCCAVVYDRFTSSREAEAAFGVNRSLWLFFLGGLSVLLIVAAFRTALRPKLSSLQAGTIAGAALLWSAAASVSLVTVFSSYHYGVLHHHCPWCLFLVEHHAVGYPLFFAIFWVLLEAVGLVVKSRTVELLPLLVEHGRQTIRWGSLRLLTAMMLYFLIAVGPALFWKMRYGVWIW